MAAGPADPTPAERSRAIQAMFSAIAPTYDLLNRLLSFGVDGSWRRALAGRLPEGSPRVLDLACGTGDVTLAALRARPEGRVWGADFSLPMLRGALPKLAQAGVSDRVTLQNASAEDLPYRDGVFDAVTIAFGIRNVVRRERALEELRRVLVPGGLALILDFSLPENPLARAGYGFYFHRVLPFLGGVVSGNFRAYRYLPRSVADFPPRREFCRLLEEQGFTSVGYEDFTFGVATLYRAVKP
ncbi:MAG: bifunctional demethylmenaquinone methyltransferase/2-methoxy-6-polyprenyl-1,4-benzoquinol methylase UbiE [Deferrisomatales bacterium]|nr:bifunctional demethylmenaquinone methyltransferase/2-methoxy-6-polyprenyl-1,4-benzoquinol methylase UbiE [Deferrisomatales bacterium]